MPFRLKADLCQFQKVGIEKQWPSALTRTSKHPPDSLGQT